MQRRFSVEVFHPMVVAAVTTWLACLLFCCRNIEGNRVSDAPSLPSACPKTATTGDRRTMFAVVGDTTKPSTGPHAIHKIVNTHATWWARVPPWKVVMTRSSGLVKCLCCVSGSGCPLQVPWGYFCKSLLKCTNSQIYRVTYHVTTLNVLNTIIVLYRTTAV